MFDNKLHCKSLTPKRNQSISNAIKYTNTTVSQHREHKHVPAVPNITPVLLSDSNPIEVKIKKHQC